MSSAIPDKVVLLFCGIPATGKSTFAQRLAREHGFAHYDLERHPKGWPRPELMELWGSNRAAFVAQLRKRHNRVVLDWGFPVHLVSWVQELQVEGARLIWFEANVAVARETFISRGGIDIAYFDKQIAAIQKAGLPGLLDFTVVPALSEDGRFLDARQIEAVLFPAK